MKNKKPLFEDVDFEDRVSGVVAFIFWVVIVACIVGVIWVIVEIKKPENQYLDVYNEQIAERKKLSMTVQPKFTVQKTYIVTQAHGSSTLFNVTKFQCCEGTDGMVRGNQLYVGTMNEREIKLYNATTTTRIPEIQMETLGHELVHLITTQPYVLQKCPALAEQDFQEDIAYNWSHLYRQILSFDEDNWLRIVK